MKRQRSLEYGKLYARKWRAANAEHHRAYTKAYRKKCNERHGEYIQSVKTACLDCGNTDKRVLQFHHRDPKTKSFPIADHVGRMWSLQKIKDEVAKCDVLCANCHLIIEHQRRLTPNGVHANSSRHEEVKGV